MADKAEVPQGDGAEVAPPPLPELTHEQLFELLDKAGEDPEFRKGARAKRWIGGIVGDLAAQQREQDRQREDSERQRADRKNLRKMLDEDPLAAATQVAVAMDKADEALEQSGIAARIRTEIVGEVGAALRSLPEAEMITPEEWSGLQDSLRGLTDKQVISVFTQKFNELVAEHRAEAKYKARHKKEMEEELAADRKERAVKTVQSRATPSPRAPSTGNANDSAEPPWPSKEWDAWDKQQQRAGLGIYAYRR